MQLHPVLIEEDRLFVPVLSEFNTILERMKPGKTVYYLIKWKKYHKNHAIWEIHSELIKRIFLKQSLITRKEPTSLIPKSALTIRFNIPIHSHFSKKVLKIRIIFLESYLSARGRVVVFFGGCRSMGIYNT